MTPHGAPSDEIGDLIRELAVEHGVALDRGDPVLMLHTATRKIVQNALLHAHSAQSTALAEHRAELELAAAKWRQDSKQAASGLLREVEAAIGKSLERELSTRTSGATAQLEKALARHDKALSRAALVCALSAAMVVLAVGTFVLLSRQHVPARCPDSVLSAHRALLGATRCS